MHLKTLAKTSIVTASLVISMTQFHGVLVKSVFGGAPLTAPITSYITPTPTDTPLTLPEQNQSTPTPTLPLTSPEQSDTDTGTIPNNPTPVPQTPPAPPVNSGGSNNNNSGNNGGNNGGGSPSNNGGGSSSGNVCRDERPKSAPIILSARATSASQVTVLWRGGWGPINSYLIGYSTKRGITQFSTPTINGERTSTYTISGLKPNTTYFFRVQSKNGCTTGDYSRELSIRTYGKSVFKPINKKLGKTVIKRDAKSVKSSSVSAPAKKKR